MDAPRKWDWVEWLLNLDRRVIYTWVVVLVALPIFFPLHLPLVPGPAMTKVFNDIDALQPGADVLIAGDYGPSSKAEIQPMLDAVITHCFIKGLHMHFVCLWPDAPSLIQASVEKQAAQYHKENGTDYALLGYKAGGLVVVKNVMESFTGAFPTDFYGKPTAGMPIYQHITAGKDVAYVVEIAAGTPGPETWIAFGTAPNKLPLAVSCTAVSAAQYAPYAQAGQITGLGTGMKGSAEYETLLREKYGKEMAQAAGSSEPPAGDATRGMDAQSAVHVFIVLTIILANIALSIQQRRERRARGKA